MNQPTDDRIKRLEERMDRIERETEPMRLERRLSIPEANTLQAIQDMVGRMAPDVAVLKTQMEGARADILAIKDSQADMRDKLIEQGTKLDRIEATQEQILKLLQQRPSE